MRDLSVNEIESVAGGNSVLKKLLDEFVTTTAWTMTYDYMKEGWRRVLVWVDQNGKVVDFDPKEYQELSRTSNANAY